MICATRDDKGLRAVCDSCGEDDFWPNQDEEAFTGFLMNLFWAFDFEDLYCPECWEEFSEKRIGSPGG